MKQKFEVPYNFDSILVNKLRPYKDFIDFIYLPSFITDGDNSRFDITFRDEYPKYWEEYETHLKIIQSDFKVGILIQHDATLELIEKYYNLGVRIFILNNNELVNHIKLTYNDIRCILSITNVLSLEDIQNNDYSMYDEIVLFFSFCRQLHKIQELPSQYKYVLMVNSHCVYNCNRCTSHWNLKADTMEEYMKKVESIINGHCGDVYREDRAYIQPNDLVYFDTYISNYKLVDRLMGTDEIVYEVDKYTREYTETRKEKEWYMIEGNYEVEVDD